MTYSAVNFGASDNDVTADTFRTGFGKHNDMFADFYGLGSAANQVWATGATYNTTESGGWLTLTKSHIPAGTIANTKLEDSGVVSGIYGGSNSIPVITVNSKGIITNVTTTSTSLELDDLTDVTATSPLLGDTLKYDGSGWILAGAIEELIETITISTGDAETEAIFTGDYSAYTKLRIEVDGWENNANHYITFQMSDDSGSTWFSTNEYAYHGLLLTNTYTPLYSTVWANFPIAGATSVAIAADSNDAFIGINIHKSQDATFTYVSVESYWDYHNTGASVHQTLSGVLKETGVINGLKLLFGTSTMDKAVIKLYGER